MHMTTFVSRI